MIDSSFLTSITRNFYGEGDHALNLHVPFQEPIRVHVNEEKAQEIEAECRDISGGQQSSVGG